MTKSLLAAILSLAWLPLQAACGDDESGTRDRVDAGQEPDGAAACPVAESLPAVTLANAMAGQETQDPEDHAEGAPPDPQIYFIFGDIGDQDVIELDLWEGYGVFAATEDKRVAPGTYEIEGDETAVATCGVCLYLLGDLVGETAAADYLATAGTVTIDSIEGDLSGHAENVTFSQVDHDTGEMIPGGCTTTVPSIEFTAPIEPTD